MRGHESTLLPKYDVPIAGYLNAINQTSVYRHISPIVSPKRTGAFTRGQIARQSKKQSPHNGQFAVAGVNSIPFLFWIFGRFCCFHRLFSLAEA